MPRRPRGGTAGFVFHVMNRSARRVTLFERDEDYAVFVRVLKEAHTRIPLRILCYVVMPNHWHLVLWPAEENELSRFMAWLTSTHSRRWHLQRRSVGSGTIYQGRYKAIPVKDDNHFLTVCRYVERNPVRARLATHAAAWRWGSAAGSMADWEPRLEGWPVARPEPWHAYVDRDDSPGEFERLRQAISSGIPFGPDEWRDQTVHRLQWRSGFRPRGRPRKVHVEETEIYPDPNFR
jgi:putative transposase